MENFNKDYSGSFSVPADNRMGILLHCKAVAFTMYRTGYVAGKNRKEYIAADNFAESKLKNVFIIMDEKLRKTIVGYFLSDSSDYLMRYKTLQEHFSHIGNRAKLLIDLMFSLECSLKALIFIESTDDEKVTYNTIKKSSHSIRKLFEKVDISPVVINSVYAFLRDNSYLENVVRFRYTLEAYRAFSENGCLGEKYYNELANPQRIDQLYRQTQKLHDYVSSKVNFLEIIKLADIDIDEELMIFNKIKNIGI